MIFFVSGSVASVFLVIPGTDAAAIVAVHSYGLILPFRSEFARTIAYSLEGTVLPLFLITTFEALKPVTLMNWFTIVVSGFFNTSLLFESVVGVL